MITLGLQKQNNETEWCLCVGTMKSDPNAPENIMQALVQGHVTKTNMQGMENNIINVLNLPRVKINYLLVATCLK